MEGNVALSAFFGVLWICITAKKKKKSVLSACVVSLVLCKLHLRQDPQMLRILSGAPL